MSSWTQSRWTITVTSANGQSMIEQEMPFALIGSDPSCQVQLPLRHMDPVVYFACCFDNKIEVWPMSAVAFPRWGIITPKLDLLLGRDRLRFQHSSVSAQATEHSTSNHGLGPELQIPDPANDEKERFTEVELTLAWGTSEVVKKIVRSVTILGNDHPSVLRAHGRGMQRCDHAIVISDQRTWLVDLNPLPGTPNEEMVHELQRDGTYYRICDMKLSLGPAETECKTSVSRHARLVSQASRSNEISGQDTSAVASTPKSFPGESMRQRPENQSLSTVDNAEDSEADELEGFDCPELLTSHVTGRLVSINKGTREKLIRMAGSVVLFVLVAIFLYWLLHSETAPPDSL